MNAGMFPIIVFGGVLAGWFAGFVMERGGYGLKWDIILGLTGSAVVSWIFWALGAFPRGWAGGAGRGCVRGGGPPDRRSAPILAQDPLRA
jgi:uncharacterized membrane protein YeaQ/YmgE (transglycosylase-associated protein family)